MTSNIKTEERTKPYTDVLPNRPDSENKNICSYGNIPGSQRLYWSEFSWVLPDYICSLTQEKGVLPLVQAWERLAPPGRTLYLMGDGPLRGELERYVASRRLESIRLTGFIPHEEQGAVRAACGLAVAPSLWEETFGMVVLESWLHGTPVIVTPRGGLPELISHGRNGWIAREPSADALAETLRTALEEEERWPSMGAHGQQLLSSTYSPAAWLQSMGSLLEELRLFRQSPNITAS